MPMVEVDELALQQSNKLRQTVESWMKNPKSRRKILEAQKLIDPKAEIPELDEPDPLETVKKETAAEIAALKKQIEDDKAARERDAKLSSYQTLREQGFKQLRSQRWTDDGIKAVEKIMEDKGILDPLDAAAIFERDHPPQTPIVPIGTGAFNFGEMPSGEDADSKYVENLLKAGKTGVSDSTLMARTYQAINDIRGEQRR